MIDPAEDDVALKLLHTADWHLGQRFSQFERAEDQRKLSRARLEAVECVLDLAHANRVHAVLCAGDLFHDPAPKEEWWQGLLACLRRHDWSERPVFLLPGNHDPLTHASVYATTHPFRQGLPPGVHVIEENDQVFPLGEEGVLYATPCRSTAGDRDLASALPPRAPDERRFRIGMVHGQTFDIQGHQTHFPVDVAAAERLGFDYLAIGDTHSFKVLPSEQSAHPVVYPSAPEPTSFKEKDAGYAALVFFSRRSRRPRIERAPVARYTWEVRRCTTLGELRDLAAGSADELARKVLRLILDLEVTVPEKDEVDQIVTRLQGTDAVAGKVAVLQVDASALRVRASGEFPQDLPPTLQLAVERLREQAERDDGDAYEQDKARRALLHLYRLVKEKV